MATADNFRSPVPATTSGWERVGRLLDRVARRATGSPDVIVAGDFRIDLIARSATVRGYQLCLEGAEFDALVYLASHRRRVITAHTRLATKPEKFGPRRVQLLPTLISLRKKLQKVVPGSHYLQTEAWILYDFNPIS